MEKEIKRRKEGEKEGKEEERKIKRGEEVKLKVLGSGGRGARISRR